jgi:hypothetical protein
MTQKSNQSHLNFVEACHHYYEDYAKNIILSFFKDSTEFSQKFNAPIELNINFYSKEPIFKWILNENELENPIHHYSLEELNIVFDYLSNFTDVDVYQRILNMTVSPDMLKNLKMYADESLANNTNNPIHINYKNLAQENYNLFSLFAVGELIENLTELTKTLGLGSFKIKWYKLDNGQDYFFGNIQNENEEELDAPEANQALKQFLLNYELEVLKLVNDNILVNDHYVDYLGNLSAEIKELDITQDFNQNLETLLETDFLKKLRSSMEKYQLEQSVKIIESKTVKQKL